ncbi:MAG: hypothetical protein WCR01_11365 [Bacteroidota bacterium]
MRTIGYLDVLGFGRIALTDLMGAIDMIYDYQTIVNNKVTDQHIHPELLQIAEKLCADSFESLLPFSDSIFIVSNQPDKFVTQISHFLHHAFSINGFQFEDPANPEDPTETTIPIGWSHERLPIHRYPLLFKGGVSYGEVANLRLNSIIDNEIVPIRNLTGQALVEAVYLEKAGKGPRLFCNKVFVDQLSPGIRDKFIGVLRVNELYEILWPASIYFDENDCRIDIGAFDTLFIPAVNLWRAFGHIEKVGVHYYEFLRLIINATLQYHTQKGCGRFARQYIEEKIISNGLRDELNEYFSEI